MRKLYIFKIFYFVIIIYNLIYLNFVYFYNSNIVGYGGDQIGLYNLFNEKSNIYINAFGVYDYLTKIILLSIGKMTPSAGVFLLFLIPFLLNLMAGYISRFLLVKYRIIKEEYSWLWLIIVSFEPLTISLLLSGHTAFMPLLPLMLVLILFNKNYLYSFIALIFIFIVNPYLCIGFLIFSVLFDFYGKKSNRYKFYFGILIAIFIKLNFEIFTDHYLDNLIGFDISTRLNSSGISPINLFIPDINSFIGNFFINFKNRYYTYLNVPESNYSIIILILLFLFIKPKRISELIIIPILLLFLCFPIHTQFLNGIYFPSYIYNFILPELRILSRNFSYLYIIFAIKIIGQININYKSCLILIILMILLMPLSLPNYDINNLILKKCEINFPLQKNDPWAEYYSKYFNIDINYYNVLVKETLDNSKILYFCYQ
ncbi:hypothetical protein G6646_00220 [Polynucleobacter paneuropaeus]|nr:hypothetical protein [Polynucleobacter paneuropaeus]QWD09512.1 hypothetical protein G6713_01815 [Polynucleobacter paneuropaeus]